MVRMVHTQPKKKKGRNANPQGQRRPSSLQRSNKKAVKTGFTSKTRQQRLLTSTATLVLDRRNSTLSSPVHCIRETLQCESKVNKHCNTHPTKRARRTDQGRGHVVVTHGVVALGLKLVVSEGGVVFREGRVGMSRGGGGRLILEANIRAEAKQLKVLLARPVGEPVDCELEGVGG